MQGGVGVWGGWRKERRTHWQSEVGHVGIGEGDAEGVQGAFRSIQHYERFNI